MSLWRDQVRAFTLSLSRQPSVTNTPGETAFGPWLHEVLSAWPTFGRHPERLQLIRTLDDRRERYNVFALSRGRGRRAVALCGHFDTVDVEGYGDLAPIAGDPEALLPALIARLERGPLGEADRRALADLRSGEYLPGRGALDMKSGLAAGLAVLEAHAARPEPEGSLIFIATPDEEDASHGMRSAIRQLAELLPAWGLELDAAINLDSGVGDSDDGKAVFLGSVGKVLPSVLFLGRPTHSGAPFDGLNAALMAACLTRRVEVNPALGDAPGAAAEVAPPPVTLYQTDRRSRYDVTTPATAWCAVNLLTYARSPAEMLQAMLAETRAAVDEAVALARSRGEAYARVAGAAIATPAWSPRVTDYATLRAEALARGAGERIAAAEAALAADASLDVIGFSQRVVELVAREAGLAGPAAVVCLASQYYPQVDVGESPRARRLMRAIEGAAVSMAREGGVRPRLRRCFPGISDMSFFAPQTHADVDTVVANTPAWDRLLRHDFEAAGRVGAPIVNIGPWGHDYHQVTERVHAPYSFEALPEFIQRVADSVLAPLN